MSEGNGWSLEDRIEDIAKRFEKIAAKMEEWRLKREQWALESTRREQSLARRKAVIDRRNAVERALGDVLQQVKLVDEAETAARLILARHPDSRWAKALATWLHRAASKLASPKRIARRIPVDTWGAMGMPVKKPAPRR